ncbi:hypothetical protein MAR_024794 [Mya arenaria]|uniref:Mitochondria-eating protein C-terminal domain-containing protein n=1 Tax=Mya arenaria TaxID=6604 RepID=A0ABY7DUA3_MYAAR|nr:hypothetical protein MAR_024794 [Mya arenaria]
MMLKIARKKNDGTKRKELNLLKKKITDLESEISSLRVALSQYEQENDELRTRLSRMASDRLLDNNPNIADLSDANRPTKIAEQFSEFYDTEYTGAFEKLLELNMTEVEATNLLFNIFMHIYEVCKSKSQNDLFGLSEALRIFTGNATMIPSNNLKHFKDIRKKQFKQYLPDLQKTIFERVLEVWIPDACRRTAEVMLFVENATEICWLISIQDPPLCLVGEVNVDDFFDKSMFREYTKRGPRYDFVVWPALLLHDGGPMLLKGIAQPKNTHSGNRFDENNTQIDDSLERRSTQIDKRFVSRISIVTSTGVNDLTHDPTDRSPQSGTSEGIETETGVNGAQVTTPVRPPRTKKAKQKETKEKQDGVERNGTKVSSSPLDESIEHDTSGSIDEIGNLQKMDVMS